MWNMLVVMYEESNKVKMDVLLSIWEDLDLSSKMKKKKSIYV